MSRIGTSCIFINKTGNLVAGNYKKLSSYFLLNTSDENEDFNTLCVCYLTTAKVVLIPDSELILRAD